MNTRPLTPKRSQRDYFFMDICSFFIALIFLGYTAEALKASGVEDAPFSLTPKLRTPEKNHILDRTGAHKLEELHIDRILENSNETYHVSAHFNLQLDYVPGELGDQEVNVFTQLLEECLLENIPPFEKTAHSAPFQLQSIEVLLNDQTTVHTKKMSKKSDTSFRLIVDMLLEGEYVVLEGKGGLNSKMDRPTDQDFEHTISRFLEADEGTYIFLYSYLTDPETTTPYFQDVTNVQVPNDEEVDFLKADSSSISSLVFLCVISFAIFMVGCYVCVR